MKPEIFLFFDTETGGFPSKKKELTDDTQPPMTQLGASLRTKDLVIAEIDTLFHVGDRYMNPRAIEANGHTSEHCNKFGLDTFGSMLAFHEMVKKADMIVGHNYNFDAQMIAIEYARGLFVGEAEAFSTVPSFCTMHGGTTALCGLLNKAGRAKAPTLMELHKFLFEEEFDGAHDAMVDVQATVRCFFDERVFSLAVPGGF